VRTLTAVALLANLANLANLGSLAILGLLVVPTGVQAQSPAHGAVETIHGTGAGEFTAFDDALAGDLSDLALGHVEAKKTEGLVLLIWGLANFGAGIAIAAAGHEDDGWFYAGVTTASWGAINAGLSLLLLDLGGAAEAHARQTRQLRGRALFARRDELIARQEGSATLFALNAGLDIAYIVAGALLYGFGAAESPTDSAMVGVGGAILAQGAALLAFDLFNWAGAASRGRALREVGP